jgi:hypothetical protein
MDVDTEIDQTSNHIQPSPVQGQKQGRALRIAVGWSVNICSELLDHTAHYINLAPDDYCEKWGSRVRAKSLPTPLPDASEVTMM